MPPSGVGDDDFVIKAQIRKSQNQQFVTIADVAARKLSVWRKVWFGGALEMTQVNHLSNNATSGIIQPYYDPAFVEVELPPNGTVKLPADLSVKYVGLWQPAAPYQKDWNTVREPRLSVNHMIQHGRFKGDLVTSEVPTLTELINSDTDMLAQEQIQRRAQAWFERLFASYTESFSQWRMRLPPCSIVGIEFYHPKISPAAGEAITNYWPDGDWMKVWNDEQEVEVDPDAKWQALGGRTDDRGTIVTIPAGFDDAQTRVLIVHEIGHATAREFVRVNFDGSKDPHLGGDHTPDSMFGIMQALRVMLPPGFHDQELEILRGYDKQYGVAP